MSAVFRCDYCGLFRPIARASVAYAFDYDTPHSCDASGCDVGCLEVVNSVYTVAITCCPSCAEASQGAARVGGR